MRQPQRKSGYAVVRLAKLALEEVMPAFKRSRAAALVSGHADNAGTVARTFDIELCAVYDSQNFERIRDNRNVEVFYIIPTNSMHAEYTVRALEAGKHVLCAVRETDGPDQRRVPAHDRGGAGRRPPAAS